MYVPDLPERSELKRRSRNLGRRRIPVVRNVQFLLDGKVVSAFYMVRNPGELEPVPGKAVHGTEVPEIGPVK